MRRTAKWASYSPDAALLAKSVQVTKAMQRLALPAAEKVAVRRFESPGRLNTRSAVAAAGMRARGQTIEATKVPLFKANRIDRTIAPPGVVGIMADVSGSMRWSTTAVGEAAWLLARGAAHSGATVASVVFGEDVDPVVFPGEVPQQVLVRSALDGDHAADRALAALDGALDLARSTHGGAPRSRVVVVLSDLQWGGERKPWIRRARRLAMQGVRFIVIGPRLIPEPYGPEPYTRTSIEADIIEGLGCSLRCPVEVLPMGWPRKFVVDQIGRAPIAAEQRLLHTAGLKAPVPMTLIPRIAVDNGAWDGEAAAVVRDKIIGAVLGALHEMSQMSGHE